ncbi:hypothetical protein M8818_001786 [Zalaria obscura]|uniref:Uncharacterized protein n=1 Tax=Zalaria obscura TaxID=2024903 RepID=A0ACC3SJW4_9PEZI
MRQKLDGRSGSTHGYESPISWFAEGETNNGGEASNTPCVGPRQLGQWNFVHLICDGHKYTAPRRRVQTTGECADTLEVDTSVLATPGQDTKPLSALIYQRPFIQSRGTVPNACLHDIGQTSLSSLMPADQKCQAAYSILTCAVPHQRGSLCIFLRNETWAVVCSQTMYMPRCRKQRNVSCCRTVKPEPEPASASASASMALEGLEQHDEDKKATWPPHPDNNMI